MTDLVTPGAPASDRGRPALRRLVAVDDTEFGASYWGRGPVATPAGSLPRGFDDLFSEAAVDELVSSRGLRTPFLRVAQGGRTLGSSEFTAPGGIGAGIADQLSDDRLLSLFSGGATLVLQGLHRTWGPLTAFCQQLAADLGHPVQANAYVTPAQNQGFADHYDVHDVFVLQVAGEKQWRIRPPVLSAPLRDQPWEQRRGAVEQAISTDPLLDVTLTPGDVLYLPRGFLHSATALGGTSTHLTLGIHTWTAHTLAEVLSEQVLRSLRDDAALRASLPFGVDVGCADALAAEAARVREAIAAHLATITDDQIASAMRQRNRATQRAAPVAPLRQVRDSETVAVGDRVRLRDHLDARLVMEGRTPVLDSRAGSTNLPLQDLSTAGAFLSTGSLTVTASTEDLARRLLLAGIAVRDNHPA